MIELAPGAAEAFRLYDGRPCVIRPIESSDRSRVAEFYARQSRQSVRLRFFVPMKTVSGRLLDRLTAADGHQRHVLVAEQRPSGDLLAIAEMERTSATSAEVAFIVDDHAHGNGLATMMLQRLSQLAREAGYTELTALTLAENACMLDVFRYSGLPVGVHFEGPQARVVIDLTDPGAE